MMTYSYIKILGRENNQRTYKWIRRDYVNDVTNLEKWKIILPKSNGSGAIWGGINNTPNREPPNRVNRILYKHW